MEFVAPNLRIVLKPIVRTKIKRRLKEAMKLTVTRGAAVEGDRRSLSFVRRTLAQISGSCLVRTSARFKEDFVYIVFELNNK
jgi:hypothetical protein